jgi:hypothetical protein
MNQKAFAIFVGAIMILSAFAGFLLRGGEEVQPAVEKAPSLETFGVGDHPVDWSFGGLGDVLQMCPEGTVQAYWVDLDKSENLTEAARAALPQLKDILDRKVYPAKIERVAVSYFNKTWVEFHWIRPFRVGYEGPMVPYPPRDRSPFMMIPINADFSVVMGQPTLFGPQKALKSVLDVILGGLATDGFTLPQDEQADLQLAALGEAKGAPLGGGYREFYLGVNATERGYFLKAKCLRPEGGAVERLKKISSQYGYGTYPELAELKAGAGYGLALSTGGGVTEVSGFVEPTRLKDGLTAFMAP